MDLAAYWDGYYEDRNDRHPVVPSQFAAFVASEVGTTARNIIDLGCGNGRDTLFFASLGYRTIGIDASESAIALCEARSATGPSDVRDRVSFVRAALPSPELDATLASLPQDDPVVVYARFFLHAVEEDVEEDIMRSLHSTTASITTVAVEFRTHRDREQTKHTPDHFRRFMSSADFLHRATELGFRPTYWVEGFGYAKFSADDAHVARVLLERA